MSDLPEPFACDVYPIKHGWKILREGIRIGLAANLETALNKITKISANLGVVYQVRVYKKDGSLEKEMARSSPPAPAEKADTHLPAISNAIAEDSTRTPEFTSLRFRGEVADAGVSLRERIALLAYSYWERRGCQGGSPEEDWYCAEREILRQHSVQSGSPLVPLT
jgi:hypothetical protein